VTLRSRFLPAAILVVALAAAGCGSSGAAIPNITGTWSGTGTFGDVDGTVKSSPETLTVTKQDGALVWGTVEYSNPDGTAVKEAVIGTFTDDGQAFVMTERTSLWQGTVSGSTMKVVVSWTGDPSHGAFEMTLTKK